MMMMLSSHYSDGTPTPSDTECCAHPAGCSPTTTATATTSQPGTACSPTTTAKAPPAARPLQLRHRLQPDHYSYGTACSPTTTATAPPAARPLQLRHRLQPDHYSY